METTQIFQTDESAISAISGLYKRLLVNNLVILNGGLTVFPGLSADEITNTTPAAELDQFRTNSIMSNNYNVSGSLWQAAYKNIYHSNAVLEGLSNSTITPGLRNQLKGEALVVRCLNYFYLINLFGDVPYVVTTDYRVNEKMPRISVEEIYLKLITDLLDAKNLLVAAYPSIGKVRPNKYTACALLARIYLYRQDWANAEIQANEILNSNIYSLSSDLNNVFLANSSETIWSLVQDKSNTAEGQTFIPAFSFLKPPYIATDYLLNAFEANDNRKSQWLNTTTVNGQPVSYPFKYKRGYDFSSNPPPPTEYYILFRLAEQVLIRAEARANLGNTSGAKIDLNVIRNRAGLGDTIVTDQASVLLAIQHERQVELFSEWGHRWFDLKRTNQLNGVLALIKAPNWQITDSLYPIPVDQVQLNPFLVQNLGY
jgi:hypothetical protein